MTIVQGNFFACSLYYIDIKNNFMVVMIIFLPQNYGFNIQRLL